MACTAFGTCMKCFKKWGPYNYVTNICKECEKKMTTSTERGQSKNKTVKSGWFWEQVKKSIEASKKWPEWMGERPWLKK